MAKQSNHLIKRQVVFNHIKSNFNGQLTFGNDNAMLLGGDSLELIKHIPDNSVSLILTDPPYHTTKKKNITNDTSFESDEDFLSWMESYSKEWHRILKKNGSIYMYCSAAMAARLEVLMMKRFNVLSNIVWTKPNDPGFDGWKQKMKKEALRKWYDYTERIIFAEPAYEGNLNKSGFGHYLRSIRTEAGLTSIQLAEIIGAYGKINHGGSVVNWEAGRNIPSREQYDKVCAAILNTGKVREMLNYEDAIRAFDVNSSVEFTNVWNFVSVRPYDGKHPAEKPLDMLEHSIVSTTYEGDIVLDCFAGSGSTAIAALNTGRKSISIEIEPQWIQAIQNRLENYFANTKQDFQPKKKHDIMKAINETKPSKVQTLF